MMRPTLNDYYMSMVALVASRATCRRRNVGCIITDDKGHLLATGYNGVPSGYPHCTDKPCKGAGDAPGDNARCVAIHAETNAIIQAGDRIKLATTLYCSCTPCFNCAKLICSTGIKKIIATELYADNEGLELLRFSGVSVYVYNGVSRPLTPVERR